MKGTRYYLNISFLNYTVHITFSFAPTELLFSYYKLHLTKNLFLSCKMSLNFLKDKITFFEITSRIDPDWITL